MNYPDRWREYVDSMKLVGSAPDSSYATWASRFRAAKSFTGMTFEGLSPASADAYFLATKLSFVDAAFEALENASNSEIGSLQVLDEDIAYSFWDERLAEMGEALSLLNNRKLASQWKEFCELDKELVQKADLRFLLRAFRHLNAHGIFTPGSASVYQSKKLRNLLIELAEIGLREMECHFSSLLDEGVLPLAAEALTSMERISAAKLRGSFYVGSIIDVEEMTDGRLLLQRNEKFWQILDMKDWSLGTPLSIKPDLKSLRATNDLRVTQDGVHQVIANLTDGDYQIWQLADGDWLIGTAKTFTRYNPVTHEFSTSITIPRGLLPKYLNHRTLGLAADGAFAVVGMDSLERSFLFLDLVNMQARLMNVPGIPAAYHAKYLGLTDVMVTLDETQSSLNFYSAQLFDVADSEHEKDLRPLELGVTQTISFGSDRNPWSNRADVYSDEFRVSRDGKALATRINQSLWRKHLLHQDEYGPIFSLPEWPQTAYVSENLDFVIDCKFDNNKANMAFRVDKEGVHQIELPGLRWAVISSYNEVADQLIFVGRKNGAVAFVNPTPLTLVKEIVTTLDQVHAALMLDEKSLAVLGRANGNLGIQVWDINEDVQLDSCTLSNAESVFSYKMRVDQHGGNIWVYTELASGILVVDIKTLDIKAVINQAYKSRDVWIDQINRRAYVLRKDDLTIQILNADTLLEDEVRGLPSQGVNLNYAEESKELFIACEYGFLAKLAL